MRTNQKIKWIPKTNPEPLGDPAGTPCLI